MTTPRPAANRMILGIMLALGLWGVYLAVGATGIFVDTALLDPRKSGIVIVFMLLFLGLWVVVLRDRRPPRATVRSDSETDAASPTSGSVRPWNRAGVVSSLLAVLGIPTWITASASWQAVSRYTTTVWGWTAAVLLAGAATAGMLALSDRSNRRGTWLGWVGLASCGGSLIVFIARMTQ